MKYPKYTREQKLSCKLSENDIEFIKNAVKLGESRTELAKIFGVNRTTIYYYIDSKIKEYRQAYNKKFVSQENHYQKYVKKSVLRKLKLQGDLLRKFDAEKHRNLRNKIKEGL